MISIKDIPLFVLAIIGIILRFWLVILIISLCLLPIWLPILIYKYIKNKKNKDE